MKASRILIPAGVVLLLGSLAFGWFSYRAFLDSLPADGPPEGGFAARLGADYLPKYRLAKIGGYAGLALVIIGSWLRAFHWRRLSARSIPSSDA